MARNLFAYPTQLRNPTASKFCHSLHMAITFHSLKILLTLLFLPHPTVSKCYQPVTWNFFELVISLNFLQRQVKNMCQLKLLLLLMLLCQSHKMLFALDVLCLSYMVSIRRLLKFCVITPPPEPFFTRFVCCFTRNTLSTFLCYDEIITKIIIITSMLNFEIYFQNSSETIHTILRIYSQHGFRKYRSKYCSNLWVKFLAKLPQRFQYSQQSLAKTSMT